MEENELYRKELEFIKKEAENLKHTVTQKEG